MRDAILVVNAGSSSLKFQIFTSDREGALAVISRGQFEGLGVAPHFVALDPEGHVLSEQRWEDGALADHAAAFVFFETWLNGNLSDVALIAAGHRVVHGGFRFEAPALVTPEVLAELQRISYLAPLHQPHAVACIAALTAIKPELPQIACFDTAFHRNHPPVADRFAIPFEYYQAGVRRYGFHGLSYEFIARRLRQLAPDLAAGRVVVAHLGNGSSLCAIRNGVSIDSTMGFTALDGMPMGTRCGSIDPGVLLYFLRQRGMSVDDVEAMLYKKSGLLGLSGISSDMRLLLSADSDHAREAVDYFVYHVVREVGALAAALGGLDGLVFTAGIGEHASQIHTRVVEALAWLGLAIDPVAHANGALRISPDDHNPSVWVIPTDEERMIARHTLDLLAGLAPA
ncbi:MAG: acetate/propionate family kinase [Azospirillaceae bacterium]|nr:acetate/propionate family kinase [Azospirillaceae bacterium]